jgi:hypothetical protein
MRQQACEGAGVFGVLLVCRLIQHGEAPIECPQSTTGEHRSLHIDVARNLNFSEARIRACPQRPMVTKVHFARSKHRFMLAALRTQ